MKVEYQLNYLKEIKLTLRKNNATAKRETLSKKLNPIDILFP